MSNPIYGLMVKHRAYRCLVCDHEQSISTNHTGKCMDHCRGCSWKGAFKKDEYHYLAGSYRPFVFCGEQPTKDDHNPHSGLEWVEPQ